MFHFYNTLLNLLSGGIIISSTGSCFSMLSSFDLVTASAVLFPINSPALWTTFLEASSPLSSICFLYFLTNDKNLYPLAYFLLFGSIEYRAISIY